VWVPEYARTYLQEHNGECSLENMIHIASSQIASEYELLHLANKVIFSDGSPIASSIWSLRYFNEVEPELQELVLSHHYDLYLLTDIDLPWKADGLRDSEAERLWLNEKFRSTLIDNGCRFQIVRGVGPARTKCAIDAVDLILS
jgi:nicotinamide riboside kinase